MYIKYDKWYGEFIIIIVNVFFTIRFYDRKQSCGQLNSIILKMQSNFVTHPATLAIPSVMAEMPSGCTFWRKSIMDYRFRINRTLKSFSNHTVQTTLVSYPQALNQDSPFVGSKTGVNGPIKNSEKLGNHSILYTQSWR